MLKSANTNAYHLFRQSRMLCFNYRHLGSSNRTEPLNNFLKITDYSNITINQSTINECTISQSMQPVQYTFMYIM